MHKTIYIYRCFFARQPQLKVLNSNKRMVTHLLIELDGQVQKQSTVSFFLFLGTTWIPCLHYEIKELSYFFNLVWIAVNFMMKIYLNLKHL